MHRRSVLAGLTAVGLGALPIEQSKPICCVQDFLPRWVAAKDFTLAVLAAMPPEGIGFAPSGGEMTFGQIFTHLGYFNSFFAAVARGEKTPFTMQRAADKPDKQSVATYLSDTFDYAIKMFGTLTESDLATRRQVIPGLIHSGAEMILRAYMHTAHHRGQAEVYLRLKGIRPPAFVF